MKELSYLSSTVASAHRSIAIAEMRRGLPFRYTLGFAALLAPFTQACSDDLPCTATATCRPTHADSEAGTELDAAPDSLPSSDALVDVDGAATPSPGDGGLLPRDGASDDRSSAEDGGSASDARRDGGADEIAPDAALSDANGDDAGFASDSSTAADGRASDAGQGPVDTTTDAPIDASSDVPICDATWGRSPFDDACLIDEQYGLFVSPRGSDATGNGTRAFPFQTIARGMKSAQGGPRRVFVCDNGSGYAEAVVVETASDGLAVYGGFDCVKWAPSRYARSHVTPASGPAMRASRLTTGFIVENLDLHSVDAAPGASSIAVKIDNSVGVVFRRSRMTAGKGGQGADGRDGAAGEDAIGPTLGQHGKAPLCDPNVTSQPGGNTVFSGCGAMGGSGGSGTLSSNSARSNEGTSGQPMRGVSPADRHNEGTTCSNDPVTGGAANGSAGADGMSGVAGARKPPGGGYGADGYAGYMGGDGTDGHEGQGGGGGVGCPASITCVGPSGGAGGAGGCGGEHGAGGGAGGASIAIYSWRSTVTLDQCEVSSSDGGAGGRGGDGGAGGNGSAGGTGNVGYDGSSPSGSGGQGGMGGPGAAGSGGNGGPSYGIFFSGERPVTMSTAISHALGGPAGAGGVTPASQITASSRAADGFTGDANYEGTVP